MGNDINDSKLVGGKRKNGHKANCSCHICENMKNKAKRGGYEEEVEKEKENMMGGSKKKNGHRKACKCPICKNMKNSKKRGGGKSSRRTRKRRGGGDDDDEKEEENATESESESDSEIEEEKEENKEEEDKEEEDKEEEDKEEEDKEEEDMKGGRKKKRGNGHKANCQCPICKNMRKKKGGYSEPDEENQLGDIEEAGIKATSGSDMQPSNSSDNETSASTNDYDALDAAERGESVGGSRKRRRVSKKRRFSKTRKARRHYKK
jgi:hypothetical protein